MRKSCGSAQLRGILLIRPTIPGIRFVSDRALQKELKGDRRPDSRAKHNEAGPRLFAKVFFCDLTMAFDDIEHLAELARHFAEPGHENSPRCEIRRVAVEHRGNAAYGNVIDGFAVKDHVVGPHWHIGKNVGLEIL